MLNAAILFWLATLLVVYTFLLYPLLIALIARFKQHPQSRGCASAASFSLVMSVLNEQTNIKRRLQELDETLKSSALPAELIVVCDGSADETLKIVRSFRSPVIRVLELQTNQGKAAALNQAARLAQHEILIFTDVRQIWHTDAIKHLLTCFQDEKVGAVSGQLVLKTPEGKLAGIGTYWKFEKWLRSKEALIHSQVGVTGAISAVRQKLFPIIPAGIILDDVYWPMQVVLQGQRVVYQPNAIAYDQLPERSADELRRKVRTLVGNFQLLVASPSLLAPWKNPVFWQFVSHKVMRLIAPWAILVMLFSSAVIDTNFYRGIFLLSASGVALGTLGMLTPLGRNNRLFSTSASFMLLQYAAWLAFWYWIFGRSGRIWTALPSQPATASSQSTIGACEQSSSMTSSL